MATVYTRRRPHNGVGKTHSLLLGEVVQIVTLWGDQRRLKCPACSHFMADRSTVNCASCGASYQQVGVSDDYTIEALP